MFFNFSLSSSIFVLIFSIRKDISFFFQAGLFILTNRLYNEIYNGKKCNIYQQRPHFLASLLQ